MRHFIASLFILAFCSLPFEAAFADDSTLMEPVSAGREIYVASSIPPAAQKPVRTDPDDKELNEVSPGVSLDEFNQELLVALARKSPDFQFLDYKTEYVARRIKANQPSIVVNFAFSELNASGVVFPVGAVFALISLPTGSSVIAPVSMYSYSDNMSYEIAKKNIINNISISLGRMNSSRHGGDRMIGGE